MLDCRYYDLCCFTDDSCNGEPECPKRYHCQFYSPMSDMKALAELADEMDRSATELLKTNDLDSNRKRRSVRREHAQDLMVVSSRIREALGVER